MSRRPEKVLVIEDELSSREAMAAYLKYKKIPVITASCGDEGLAQMDNDVAVVLTDLKMPGLDGMAVLREIRARYSGAEVIIITAYGDISSAVEAMRLGAADYLTKPVNPEELFLKIRRIFDSRNLRRENIELKRQLGGEQGFEGIIGISPAMLTVFQKIQIVATTSSTVLITGPSGSGKELVARAIHQTSPRRNLPFIAISGAAIPETLVESELFGHVKGAFTGAIENAIGKFEAADGGTLFIDEIAELNLSIQAKLLRVLEDYTFSPVGSNAVKKVDVRMVFATNKDLGTLVAAGAFREDLYYRVKVINIRIPPLADRREDIPVLADYFIRKFAARHGRSVPLMARNTLECLRRYDWPGNVRELRNCMESAVVLLQKKELMPEDLPPELQTGIVAMSISPALPSPMTVEALEREAIENALHKFGGNRTRSAESLGLSVRTLQRKIARYHIPD